jgi:hypothetical protein
MFWLFWQLVGVCVGIVVLGLICWLISLPLRLIGSCVIALSNSLATQIIKLPGWAWFMTGYGIFLICALSIVAIGDWLDPVRYR